jgi:putative tryptophan/tyrosine transport system substrate-binding protein
VTVIVAQNAPTAFAAKAATSIIPIVFIVGVDPVQLGLVSSLNHPGGNTTGVADLTAELAEKRLDLLHDLLPANTVTALLVNPTNVTATRSETSQLQDAALALGLRLEMLRAGNPSEVEAAFETLIGLGAGGLIVSADPFFTSQRAQIVALSARYAVPAIYAWRLFPAIGELMSYGSDIADLNRQLALYTAKILNGAAPADLPVQQVVKLELVINLKTAKALGLTIPPLILARADKVIE